MYEKYYNLTVDPFRLVPDYRFSYGHSSYSNAKAYLEYALFRGEGFITITGQAGTGKTTLINQMIAELDNSKVKVATITGSQLEAHDLLEMVAASFNLKIKSGGKSKLLLALEDFFAAQRARGQRSLIVVDEAQDLPVDAVEELRLLSNLQRESQLLLQVFLVGQEKLRDLILRPEMDHLRQRIVASAHLETLTLDETVSYVEHRLRKVGWKGDPQISGTALNLIHESSGGTPRRINLICSRLFLYCSLDKKHKFTIEDARSVIDDLRTEALIDKPTVDKSSDKNTDNALNAKYSLPREPVKGSVSKTSASKASGSRRQTKASPSTSQQPTARRKSATRKAAENTRRPTNTAHTKPVMPPTRSSIRPTRAGQATAVRPGHRPAPPPPPPSARRRGKTNKKPAWVQPSLYIAAGAIIALVLSGVFRGDDVGKSSQVATAIVPNTAQELAQLEPEKDLEMERSDPVTLEEMIAPSALDESDKALDSSSSDTARLAKFDESSVASPGTVELPSTDTEAEIVNEDPAVLDASNDPAINFSQPSVIDVVKESAIPVVTQNDSVNNRVLAAENKNFIAPVRKPEFSPVVSSDTVVVKTASTENDRQQAIDEQTQRVKADAQARLATNLAKYSSNGSNSVKDVSIVIPREPVVRASEPVVVPAKISINKPVKQKLPVSKAITINPERKASEYRDQLKSTLLGNQWSSRGKPATLLPSIATLCKGRDSSIDCSSKPKNVTTKYGLAVYKVEARLSEFSATGKFNLGYRTLVMLVDEPLSITNGLPDSDDERWQITEKVMGCRLSRQEGNVRCEDEKGVTRSYQISSAAALNVP